MPSSKKIRSKQKKQEREREEQQERRKEIKQKQEGKEECFHGRTEKYVEEGKYRRCYEDFLGIHKNILEDSTIDQVERHHLCRRNDLA